MILTSPESVRQLIELGRGEEDLDPQSRSLKRTRQREQPLADRPRRSWKPRRRLCMKKVLDKSKIVTRLKNNFLSITFIMLLQHAV